MHIGSKLRNRCADCYRLPCQEEVLTATTNAECMHATHVLKQRLLTADGKDKYLDRLFSMSNLRLRWFASRQERPDG